MEFGPEQIDDGFGSFQCGNEEKEKQCAQETSCKNKTQTINRGAIIITRERGIGESEHEIQNRERSTGKIVTSSTVIGNQAKNRREACWNGLRTSLESIYVRGTHTHRMGREERSP